MSEDHKEKRQPGAVMSSLVLGVAIAVLLLGVVLFDYDIHVVLFCALTVMCIASILLGYSFMDLVDCVKKFLGQTLAAIIIFISIDIIIGSLILSGTVPALIYYGLQCITLDYFLPISLLLYSPTSTSIGTSWRTVGTMGPVMMGIGAGMGIPVPLIADVVISGAFFGGEMFSISDSTNLTSAATGTVPYAHIGAMWKTTSLFYIIALAVLTVLRLLHHGGNFSMDTVNLFLDTIDDRSRISPLVLMLMVMLLILNLIKYPAAPSMAIDTVLIVLVAVFYQGYLMNEVVAGLNYGYVESTDVELVDKLLLRGGI